MYFLNFFTIIQEQFAIFSQKSVNLTTKVKCGLLF